MEEGMSWNLWLGIWFNLRFAHIIPNTNHCPNDVVRSYLHRIVVLMRSHNALARWLTDWIFQFMLQFTLRFMPLSWSKRWEKDVEVQTHTSNPNSRVMWGPQLRLQIRGGARKQISYWRSFMGRVGGGGGRNVVYSETVAIRLFCNQC